MRAINHIELHCPVGWDARAAQAKADARNNLAEINRRSQVWRDLKDPLADLSCDKCWYCEVIQERSDNAVDHFRPKSVYPWLAFDKGNLRYSCTYCNSARKNPETGETEGKADDFPLFDEAQRAQAEGQEGHEDPILLDPCRTHDPGLLDFYADGRPCARYPNHGVRKWRATTSIKVYHLDHPDLNEKRRLLAAELASTINEADALFDQCDAGNQAINNAFSGLIRRLRNAISESAELSAFARTIVAGARDKEWVDALLATA